MGAKPLSLKQTKISKKKTLVKRWFVLKAPKSKKKRKEKRKNQNQYIQTVVLGSAAGESL